MMTLILELEEERAFPKWVFVVSGGNRIDCVKCQTNTTNGQRQVSLFWVSAGRGRWWKVVANGVEQAPISFNTLL